MASKKPGHSPKRKKNGNGRGDTPPRWRRFVAPVTVALSLMLAAYVVHLDINVRQQFEGKRWAVPASVYARPLELYPGQRLTRRQLVEELQALGYQRGDGREIGSYRVEGRRVALATRPFRFWDGQESSRRIEVDFDDSTLIRLREADSDRPLTLARLEPRLIGKIYPSHREDRILVRLDEVPQALTTTLLAIEDRRFYEHHGVAPRSILRAIWANLRAGRTVQGGSTLTQQLVKNFYLTNERTLRRKLNEAIMALLLEYHYSKDEILEAYLNEIYLGQDGQRSIHGFGLAARFYFGRPLQELRLSQVATLVGMVKGPSYYDPRRHPQRAIARRNLVLRTLAQQRLIDETQLQAAFEEPLGVIPGTPSGITRYPAFMELVRRQLYRDYRDDDLRSEGMQIFTTLDPLTQAAAEQALDERLNAIERERGMESGVLEGAAVVTEPASGEILAVVGGRQARFAGFNRALNAIRPIGSLIKPAIYLTALEQPERFTLVTPLKDEPVALRWPNGDTWSPQNYDHQSHGEVPLYLALAHSYNLATVRLGLQLGVDNVLSTVRKLGVYRSLNEYPSVLLGAAELSPLEVTQMYQTIANGGFRSPLRAIREVLTAEGEPLQRYPLDIEQAADPAAVYLLDRALQMVVSEGTGRALYRRLSPTLGIAGKTGTTDGLRDSWFAGFTGDRLAVVWVGRDDNGSTGLSGSSGALLVWRDMIEKTGVQPLMLVAPEGIRQVWVEPYSGLRSREECPDAVWLPFIDGSAPADFSECGISGHDREKRGINPLQQGIDLLKGIFQ